MALLLAIMVDSSGQSRQEPPRQNPGGTQQRTNTEQRDTDQVPPSIIKKLPAEDIQQKPAADEQKGQDNRSDTWALSDKIAVIASIVALLQFFALVGTVFVLMSTARRQLRAYVLVSSAQIHDFGIEHPPRVEVIIKNSGQTPAFDLLSWGGMIIEKFPLNIELALPPPDIKQSQTAQGPGDSSSHSITAGRPLTKIETPPPFCVWLLLLLLWRPWGDVASRSFGRLAIPEVPSGEPRVFAFERPCMMPDHVAGRVARRLIFSGIAGEISVPEFGGIFGKEFVADAQHEGERGHVALRSIRTPRRYASETILFTDAICFLESRSRLWRARTLVINDLVQLFGQDSRETASSHAFISADSALSARLGCRSNGAGAVRAFVKSCQSRLLERSERSIARAVARTSWSNGDPRRGISRARTGGNSRGAVMACTRCPSRHGGPPLPMGSQDFGRDNRVRIAMSRASAISLSET